MTPASRPPSREEIAAAAGRTVPDVIAPGLSVLFCGINPGLYSGATGHHFARPGNRFWPVLQRAGFTEELIPPREERRLLDLGLGVTNLVARATAAAAELTASELSAGRHRLERRVRRFRPRCVAVLGIGAYRAAFAEPTATVGRQPRRLAGATVWVLPNPSGLNASHRLADLTCAFRALHTFVSRDPDQRRKQPR